MNPTYPAAQLMSQTRLEQLKRIFHVFSPNFELVAPSKRRLRHAKAASEKFKAYRMPSTNVSVDKAMIRCTGHSQDTYKMHNKPIQQCFKFYCLADRNVRRPDPKALCRNQPGRSILSLITHSRSIAVGLAICLSICH
jgi:hypothetical protein